MSTDKSIENMCLDGGCFCFDFVNTVHSRTEQPRHEYLKTYFDLLTWCERTEVVPEKRLRMLTDYAESNPEKADKAIGEIKKGREILYHLFTNIAADKPVGGKILDHFNRLLSESLSNIRMVSNGAEVENGWNESGINLMEPVWRVVKSGYDMLTGQPRERIKECEACGWIFLDQSKNRSRRWCNMQTCGSAHKAKKYYQRKKKKDKS